jgi:spermidine synthase
MMAFLLFMPAPKRALLIGLGGGSVAKFMFHRLPRAQIRAVEVSPQVVAIARNYFQVPAGNPRLEIIVADGSEYIEREDAAADAVIVDGYDADAHAEELASKSFYEACRERLNPGGMFVVNLWGGDRQFSTLLKRIEGAFQDGTLCLPAERPGNVIVFGFRDDPGPFEWKKLAARADKLEDDLGLEFPRFTTALRKMNRHDANYLYPFRRADAP